MNRQWKSGKILRALKAYTKILCFDYNTGKFVKKFPAIYAAVEELKVPQGSIIRVLSGKRKSTHGYYFEYETVKEE
ncbi:hypothetical protein HMPREF1214_02545 [Bacteroides sp. HPS0048]|uniref:hypothetical protein n=1 Tax=Bacteroides sp. HPS0048 TaxID=1078089 RepID=UPI000366DFAD|nr:hypothetical protein [Bacteroides sp. HPS0048]EOA57511.1 hypothetical protein HMPREF1214_02545 [Bacteroides sp. HPS0048]